MRFSSIAIFAALTLCPFVLPASAAIVVSVDLDRNTAGLQSVLDVRVGDTINASLLLQIDDTGAANVGGYVMSTIFDGATMSFTDPLVVTPTPPPNFFEFNAAITDPDSALGGGIFTPTGAIRNINAGTFGAGLATFSGDIFQFDLLATAVTGAGVTNNVQVGEFAPIDGFVDSAFPVANPLPASYLGGTIRVSAVPEPGMFAALGVAACGIGYRQRRKSKQARETQPQA